MSVDITTVMLHRVLVQVLEYHIPDLPVVPLQVSITPPLPVKIQIEEKLVAGRINYMTFQNIVGNLPSQQNCTRNNAELRNNKTDN